MTSRGKPQPGIQLQPGETALVGYGSLLSLPSLERTLGHSYMGPFLRCVVQGWRRTWDAAMPNKTFYTETADGRMTPEGILYLNVRRDPASSINGMVFVVNPVELAAYDRRESIYKRVDVTRDLDVRVEGGAAYLYECQPEYIMTDVKSPAKAAVRASYLNIVEHGLENLDEEFRQRYRNSTDNPPAHLVIDDRT